MGSDKDDAVTTAVTICTFRGWVHGCKSEAQLGSTLCYWHSREPKTRERLEVEREAGRTDFSGADFRGSDLQDYPFCGQVSDRPFSGMKLVEADFSKANLANANFTGCDLWRAKFLFLARLANHIPSLQSRNIVCSPCGNLSLAIAQNSRSGGTGSWQICVSFL